MKKNDLHHLQDIFNTCDTILAHTEGITLGKLMADDVLRAAIERWLTIIGEAVGRLSEAYKEAHGSIPWQDIKGMRNYIMHVYDGVSYEILLDTIEEDIPRLYDFVKAELV